MQSASSRVSLDPGSRSRLRRSPLVCVDYVVSKGSGRNQVTFSLRNRRNFEYRLCASETDFFKKTSRFYSSKLAVRRLVRLGTAWQRAYHLLALLDSPFDGRSNTEEFGKCLFDENGIGPGESLVHFSGVVTQLH